MEPKSCQLKSLRMARTRDGKIALVLVCPVHGTTLAVSGVILREGVTPQDLKDEVAGFDATFGDQSLPDALQRVLGIPSDESQPLSQFEIEDNDSRSL